MVQPVGVGRERWHCLPRPLGTTLTSAKPDQWAEGQRPQRDQAARPSGGHLCHHPQHQPGASQIPDAHIPMGSLGGCSEVKAVAGLSPLSSLPGYSRISELPSVQGCFHVCPGQPDASQRGRTARGPFQDKARSAGLDVPTLPVAVGQHRAGDLGLSLPSWGGPAMVASATPVPHRARSPGQPTAMCSWSLSPRRPQICSGLREQALQTMDQKPGMFASKS